MTLSRHGENKNFQRLYKELLGSNLGISDLLEYYAIYGVTDPKIGPGKGKGD